MALVWILSATWTAGFGQVRPDDIRVGTVPLETLIGALAVPADGEVPQDRPAVLVQLEFEADAPALTDAARDALDQVGTALQDPALAERRFRIEGLTDSGGDADYDLALSQRRAEGARMYLLHRHGIPPERLDAVGLGGDPDALPGVPDRQRRQMIRIVDAGPYLP